MKGVKLTNSSDSQKRMRPALTPESRENQLVSLAMDLVEKRLLEGTASSQETTHFLKIASTKERLEMKILEKQEKLIEAKTKSLESTQRIEELYANALKAMQNYSGQGSDNEEQ